MTFNEIRIAAHVHYWSVIVFHLGGLRSRYKRSNSNVVSDLSPIGSPTAAVVSGSVCSVCGVFVSDSFPIASPPVCVF